MKRPIVLILMSILFSFTVLTCAGLRAKPYGQYTRGMLQSYRNGQFSLAYARADGLVKFSARRQKQDYYLTLLERGKVALANGNYDQAINDLQVAEKKFLKIEGQFSFSEEATSLFSNERGKLYEVDPHEMLLISPYLALAYLSKGDFPGARVERNRTINKINHYIEKSRKRRYLENPFSRYVSALIYEMEGKSDDAKIEYRKMAKYSKYLRYMKKAVDKVGKKSTDLVVLVDAGVAPYKYEIKYGPTTMRIGRQIHTIAFAYAGMRPSPSRIHRCRVYVDRKKMGKTRLLYDLETTVITRHKKTQSRRIGNMLKRIAIKIAASAALQAAGNKTKGAGGAILKIVGWGIGAAGAYMEKADLRQWSTLPKNIQYIRIPNLKPGNHLIKIRHGGGVQEKQVVIKKDTVTIAYFVSPF